MRTAVFDTRRYDRASFTEKNAAFGHELTFFEHRLTADSVPSAAGFPAVCAFVNDRLDRDVLGRLRDGGTRFIALRCAGFNHVDLPAAAEFGIRVARVPEYSPYAVAEHTVALILSLNRKICRASARVHDLNFSLDGLIGFDLHGKTVGLIGAGRIGGVMARIMAGFGCEVLIADPRPDAALSAATGARYVPREEVLSRSDIISLHLPLTPETRHLLDEKAFALMKEGVMVINTGRGALIDTRALIGALKSRRVGAAGLDVYEEEEGVFFQDLSEQVLEDDVLARLLSFPNVLITSHQAFLTHEALANIAEVTLSNLRDFEAGVPLKTEVRATLGVPEGMKGSR